MLNKTAIRVIPAVVLAACALFFSAWLAAAGSECTWLIPPVLLPGAVWATIILLSAVVSLPVLDATFTAQGDKRGIACRTINVGALSLGLAAAILLSFDAAFSGILLVYYFGLWLVSDYVRRLLLPQQSAISNQQSAISRRLAAYFDDAPHAPFIIVALFLLVVTAINLAAGRELNAERLANWAYGFLVLGVGAALLNQVAWPQWVKRLFKAGRSSDPTAEYAEGVEKNKKDSALSARFASAVRFFEAKGRLDSARAGAPVFGLATLLLVVGYALVREEVSKQIPSPFPEAVVQAGKLAGPHDLILGVGLDYPLRCAYHGKGTIKVLAADEIASVEPELGQLLSADRKVFLFHSGDVIPDKVVATFRRLGAVPAPQSRVAGVYIYRGPLSAADLRPLSIDAGGYSLSGETHPAEVVSANILTALVRLRRLAGSGDQNALGGFVLVDDRSYAVAAALNPIADVKGVPASLWVPDETHDAPFDLPVPIGTTPGDYNLAFVTWPADAPRLRVGWPLDLQTGVAVSLGRVSIVQPKDVGADPFGTFALLEAPVPSIPKDIIRQIGAPSLDLAAYGFDVRDYQPGEHLHLTIVWQGRAANDLPVRIRLLNQDTGYDLYEGPPANGRYPFMQRVEGEYGVDYYDLVLPSAWTAGQSLLQVAVGDSPFQSVAYIVIRPGPRDFVPPSPQYSASTTFGGVAELIGYDLSETELSAGGSLTATLYWKAISAQPIVYPYTVFVHLTGEDPTQLIAQQDSPPADGTWPTTDWVLGETIRDVHVIPIPAGAPAGKAWLNVGLYRSDTLERLPLRGEEETEWRLPTAVVVRR